MNMKISDIRRHFPILSSFVYGKKLVYLDNAATAQRLDAGVELQSKLENTYNANIHRAVHYLSSVATDEYEKTRDAAQKFLNADLREEIIFTSGTTSGINLVASSFGEKLISENDEILLTEEEHHSNIVPWQLLAERKKALIKVIPVDESGNIEVSKIDELINERTKIVAITHVSNVIGIINPIKEIVRICHNKGVPVLVDGAQGIVHCKVDVADLDCDFYAFSGHKIYAATGTGVLYGKKKWLDLMPPFMGGGEMVGTVKFTGTTYAPLPEKFEAGTQNINGIPTLRPSFEFINSLNDNELDLQIEDIKKFIYDKLSNDNRIILYGVPHRTKDKIPLFSFSVKGVHHEDLALILDKLGIAVRSGQMCAEPIMDKYGVTGMIRASFAPYNTFEEAEYFINSLDKAIKMLL